MKTDSLDIYGSLTVEILPSLPIWDSSCIGRVIYSISNDNLYIGKSGGFELAGSSIGFGGLDWNPDSSSLEVVTKHNMRTSISRHGSSPTTQVYWSSPSINATLLIYSFCTNSSENIMCVGASGGYVYVSTNGGISFTRYFPIVASSNHDQGNWSYFSCNSDGSRIYGAYNNSTTREAGVYVSTDYGQTWSRTLNLPNAIFHGIACSNTTGENDTIIVCTRTFYVGGRLYLSRNGGASWTETRPAGNVDRSWWFVDCSDDGEFLMAGVYGGGSGSYTGGRIYISSDGGTSWSETRPAGDASYYWISGRCGGDGSVLFVNKYNGFYLSTNMGSSWTTVTSPASIGAQVACSDTGQYLIAAREYGSAGYCYISDNYGSSWSSQTFKTSLKQWGCVWVNGSGTKFSAMTYWTSNLYIGSYETKVGTPLLKLTAYDLILSVRGGKPPYQYAIKKSGSTYSGNETDPRNAYLVLSCADISNGYVQLVVRVIDSTNLYSESKTTVYVADLLSNCPI